MGVEITNVKLLSLINIKGFALKKYYDKRKDLNKSKLSSLKKE